jgi:hypothetical protein
MDIHTTKHWSSASITVPTINEALGPNLLMTNGETTSAQKQEAMLLRLTM